jgi:nucleoside-diphosphate-sugar epimerase
VKPRQQFTWLEARDRLLITGATGWLGRELLARLHRNRPDVEIKCIASSPRQFQLEGTSFQAEPWDAAAVALWRPTLAIHLAYLTREVQESIGLEDYELQNVRLSELALSLYRIPSLRGLVVASSGAALADPDGLYGRLKALDEERFREAGQAAGIPTAIARIWSVSGAHCTKPDLFALYDLIRQVRVAPEVRITAQREVWRRYVDAGEYLEICLGAVASGAFATIDSGGDLVEIGELVQVIQTTLGVSQAVVRSEIRYPANHYYATTAAMSDWAESLGVGVADIRQQILVSERAVMGRV